MHRTLPLLSIALVIAVTVPLATRASDGDYLVVVNANNPFSGDEDSMRAQVKRLFLGLQHSWPDNDACTPFARPADNPAQVAFAREILGMSERELSAHWLRLKQTTGATPPEAVSSARSLLLQISRNVGGMSVIADSEAKLPAKVRVLFKFSGAD